MITVTGYRLPVIGKTHLRVRFFCANPCVYQKKAVYVELLMDAGCEFSHTGVIAEVKRNERKLSMSKLEEKVARLPAGSFGKYHFELKGLSIENM